METNPSPDPAQCGKPTALGTPFFYVFMETSRMKAEVYLVQNLKKNSPTIHKFQCTLGSVLVFLGI